MPIFANNYISGCHSFFKFIFLFTGSNQKIFKTFLEKKDIPYDIIHKY